MKGEADRCLRIAFSTPIHLPGWLRDPVIMSIYALKPKFQNLLRPMVRGLHAAGITANQVTLLACALSMLLGLALYLFTERAALFYLLPLWFFLRMALNAIDGMLAREFGQQSRLGGYLNEVTDIVADAMLYLQFALLVPQGALAVGVVIFLAALTETVGILGQVHGNGRRYDGPVGKSDRAFVFGALGLWYAVTGSLGAWSLPFMWVLAALLAFTCWRRLQRGLA